MSEELKPCPFCGAKTALVMDKTWTGQGWRCVIKCLGCGASIGVHPTEEQAVDAWNTRAKRTCRWKRYEPADAWETECGEMLTWAPEGFPPYCPNCGRKVIDDE